MTTLLLILLLDSVAPPSLLDPPKVQTGGVIWIPGPNPLIPLLPEPATDTLAILPRRLEPKKKSRFVSGKTAKQ
jgi:hypothetical protein